MPTTYSPEPVPVPAAPPMLDKTVKETPTGQKLLKMRVLRTDAGLEIEMQSDIEFAKFFKVADGAQRLGKFQFGGVTCIESRLGIRVHTGHNLVLNRNDQINYDGHVNFSFLMAQDLKEGVTFKFQNMPMSAEGLKEWAGTMKEVVKALYQDYLKPVDITVSLTAVVKEHEA